MAIHMSEQEARRAGLITKKPSTRKTGAAPREKDATRCATCLETMAGETAEERHTREAGHHRYEMIMEGADVPMG